MVRGRKPTHKTDTMPFRTDERDHLYRLIQKYKTSPFTGRCYMDEVTLYKEKKTGLYHILLTEKQIQEFNIIQDFSSPYGFHQLMSMIKPTDEDKDFIIFRKKED